MMKSGIMSKRIPDSKKGIYYRKIFPISHEPFTYDSFEQIRLFSNKISDIKETNMTEFVDYCLSIINQV